MINLQMNCDRQTAQVSLPVILLISSIIIEIAIAGSFVAYFLSAGGLGERLTARARVAALSGVYDAMIKITRNKDLGTTAYGLNIGDDAVSINITKTDDNPPSNFYTYTITALATASSRQKKFIGVMIVDKTNGRVKFKSIAEAALAS